MGLIGAADAVQVWTLIGAALAVAASLGGILMSAHLSRRSEKGVWVRDFRLRLYGEATITAERWIANLVAEARADTAGLDVSDRGDLYLELEARLSEVVTFGADEVAKQAAHLNREVLGLDRPNDPDPMVEIQAVRRSLALFRLSVRGSLKIPID